MSDKVYQAIQEVILEVSDDDRVHVDPDIIDRMANRIASFLMKGVGNPNPVFDLLVKAHSEGKYPASTPQGHGDNLRDYANRMMAMFMGPSLGLGDLKKKEGGKTLLNVSTPVPEMKSYRGTGDEGTLPVPPKASEKAKQTHDDSST